MEGTRRLFKIAVAAESVSFQQTKRIESGLDKNDGFIHLSDRNMPPVVARDFFTDCKDLKLIEIDTEKLKGPVKWVIGKMGDVPDKSTFDENETIIHYLLPEGCAHVYGKNGVTTDAIVREADVPLGADGVHIFPEWM